MPGSRLTYTLNIIDTPGFGNTAGLKRDEEIVEQIRTLFTATDSTGIAHLDAVCFVIKASNTVLTDLQKYIFNAVLSIFGKDIDENICVFATFADSKTLQVNTALEEANFSNHLLLPFNNVGLFANNTGPVTMMSLLWDMEIESFDRFFTQLNKLNTKSLNQTKEVLKERKQAELTIENLLPVVEAGLQKIEELRGEIRIIAQHKLDIKANKAFKYTASETSQEMRPLQAGLHVTNCLHCNETCHENCAFADDDDKYQCVAMDSNGQCTQCQHHCNWREHKNIPYIFAYKQKLVEYTYKDKLAKYEIAVSEKDAHEQVIQKMLTELNSYEDNILKKIEKLNEFNNRLNVIGLRSHSLDTDGYIDILIESEKNEMKPGFNLRIQALNHFKKKGHIAEDAKGFSEMLADIKNQVDSDLEN